MTKTTEEETEVETPEDDAEIKDEGEDQETTT